MKSLVIYKSKSGYTKTYAEWLSKELKCDIMEASFVTLDCMLQYDTIIYGGGLYATGINGINLIKKNYEQLHGKNIIVWATGLNPGRIDELEKVWNHNFNSEQRLHIKTFYLRGGFDYSKLKASDKALMNMLKIKLKRNKNRTEDEEGMLQAYSNPQSYCKKENIKKLISYIKEL